MENYAKPAGPGCVFCWDVLGVLQTVTLKPATVRSEKAELLGEGCKLLLQHRDPVLCCGCSAVCRAPLGGVSESLSASASIRSAEDKRIAVSAACISVTDNTVIRRHRRASSAMSPVGEHRGWLWQRHCSLLTPGSAVSPDGCLCPKSLSPWGSAAGGWQVAGQQAQAWDAALGAPSLLSPRGCGSEGAAA